MTLRMYTILGAPIVVAGERRERNSEFTADDKDPVVIAFVRSRHIGDIGPAPMPQSEIYLNDDDDDEDDDNNSNYYYVEEQEEDNQ